AAAQALAGRGEARDDPASGRKGARRRLPPEQPASRDRSRLRTPDQRSFLRGFERLFPRPEARGPRPRHFSASGAQGQACVTIDPVDGAETSRRLLTRFVAQEPVDLARAALAVAREEYPE